MTLAERKPETAQDAVARLTKLLDDPFARVTRLHVEGARNALVAAATALDARDAEIVTLRHDIVRHIQIASGLEADNARLRAVLDQIVNNTETIMKARRTARAALCNDHAAPEQSQASREG